MSTVKKVVLWIIALAAAVAVLGAGVLFIRFPNVDPPPVLSVDHTPARLARGEYLFSHVAVCIHCHSRIDSAHFAAPVIPGTEGMGGELFGPDDGFPGKIYARNITPSAIGSWTDGELYRALVSGANKSGTSLFPIMPYPNYDQLSEEDLASIIAYVRTLTPKASTVPDRSLDFPLNLIVRTIPAKHTAHAMPDRRDPIALGRYLVTAASCGDCHTMMDKGTPVDGMTFAGGMEFHLPAGVVRTANITPDEETGIGSWPREMFIARFKEYAGPEATIIDTAAMKRQTVMPWTQYAGMTEQDLGAIYAYLRTRIPVKHLVETYTPATH
jgi:cytochrome c553